MADTALRTTVQILHDVGLATWVGGTTLGKFALNPAVRGLSDPRERGKLVNAFWGAANVVNVLAFAAFTSGWVTARATEVRPKLLSARQRRLATTKDVLMAATLVSGAATGVQGVRLARSAPGGAVPIESGTTPGTDTPPAAARIQSSIGVLANLDIALGYALVAVNAVLQQEGGRGSLSRSGWLRRWAPWSGG